MTKKVAIITMIDNDNYGNRLQNYATYTFYKKLGCYPVTIKNDNRLNNKVFVLNFIKKVVSFSLRRLLFLVKNTSNKRYKQFKKFNKNIKFTKCYKSIYNVGKFDYYLVGSDQVWKPTYGRLSDMDLLSFAPNHKRISYAASFGIDELPEKYQEKSGAELKKFKAISVREDKGKEIVEKLTSKKDVEVLIDPTMLLDAEEWDRVSKKPEQLNSIKNKKYILSYFLGEVSDNRKKEIERVAKNNKCEIIDILDKKSPFYECGPSEFLYLEKNAFLICTDSFHSSVFAILYDTSFIVFEREDNRVNMSSRIETLLSKFKLEDRKFTGKISNKSLEHDYTETYKILKKERRKSEVFLKKALDIKV